MFYMVSNALHDVLGIQRPDGEDHAIYLLKEFAPEMARLRAIADVAAKELGATTPDELTAAIAALRA